MSTKFSTLALQRPSQTLASKKLQIHAAYKGLDGAQSNAQWGWIEKLFILSSLVCIGDMCKKFAVLGKFFARAVLSLSLVNNSYVLYRLEDLYFASRRAKNGPVRHETLIRAVLLDSSCTIVIGDRIFYHRRIIIPRGFVTEMSFPGSKYDKLLDKGAVA